MAELSRSNLHTRDMQSKDLSAVLQLERNAQQTPWSRLSFEESLTRKHRCRVVENGNDIVAFSIVCPVLDELHILNLVAAPAWQGHGLGHWLMQDILDYAHSTATCRLLLEVRASNDIARGLYEKWQFKQIAVRKDYYRTQDKRRENALVFMRELQPVSAAISGQ
ncbi:MAG: ribosomal protein S18-alanine N-acetyltransferase [Gammaproteobacteria bacterium]|nr:ribosomal protein S18-alanine N-acetyltransferase [Gammaproteobacteria bacterium]